jgi:hypothetical protein
VRSARNGAMESHHNAVHADGQRVGLGSSIVRSLATPEATALPHPDHYAAELRLRALHVRQLAEYFEHDEAGRRLHAFADDLEAQADVLERRNTDAGQLDNL